MVESSRIRTRSEEPVVVEVTKLQGLQRRMMDVLLDDRDEQYAIEHEHDISIKAANKERVRLDKEIIRLMDELNADDLTENDVVILERIYKKGSESWDDNYIRMILTPEQHTKARKTGNPSVYLMKPRKKTIVDSVKSLAKD